MEVRQSVRAPVQDGRTDGDAEEELLDILDGCELECFAPETALVFENAIERLFMPTASVLAMPRFRKAACGQSSDGWTA